MSKQYSKFGPAPTPASRMLRSMLLSIPSDFTSITRGANELKIQPLYAIASGFSPDKTPGASTYYDFIKRLWNADTNNFSANIRLPNEKVKKPGNPNEKAAPIEKETIDEALPVFETNPIDANTPFSILFKIFEKFLLHSHELGLINLNKLILAGDGTPVVTSHRQRTHNVKPEDLPNNMPTSARYYSQSDCDVGWDSSRHCFYSGYDLYLLTDVTHDLPVFPLLGPATRHDSFGLLHNWFNFKAHMPQAKVNSIILDSAHDVMAFYKYFYKENITAYIDINKRATKPTLRDGFTLDADNRPSCPGGFKMWRDGTDYKRMRTKYICPKLARMVKITMTTCNDSPTDNLRGRVCISLAKTILVISLFLHVTRRNGN